MIICILGRQPEIGLAELESLYGSESVRLAGENCALVDADVTFSRLGSSVKIAELLDTLEDASRKTVFKQIASILPELLGNMPAEGKIKLGVSVYGYGISPYELNGEMLRLKKIIRKHDRSARVVPNDSPSLSSAQTFHNKLAENLGLEFVVVKDGDKTHIGRITAVQDINAYRIRDRERPKRDAFVGMLPPKLAQTIINLAVCSVTERSDEKLTILDPFCGTGVILQEALLMGYDAYGTDIAEKMIAYTTTNLEWLDTKYETISAKRKLTVADATKFTWSFPEAKNQKSTVHVASETYLGQPLGGQNPTPERLSEIIHSSNVIVRDFLKNIAPQLEAKSRHCIAVPAWTLNGKIYHLPVLDDLATIGFEVQRFKHAPHKLIYRRDDQITGRELVVLVKQ